jgi:hypothetical protein
MLMLSRRPTGKVDLGSELVLTNCFPKAELLKTKETNYDLNHLNAFLSSQLSG